ncbi:MAG: hypothetical protein BWK76_17135 [Desulfobulbaceae bacterium A2]|nr:MAG: hypothetical protein BWK76_17135 [Desulfobulbaceae bacterium A2]
MKITDSAVLMSASHASVQKDERRETLVAWRRGGDRRELSNTDAEGRPLQELANRVQQEAASQVDLSDAVAAVRSRVHKGEVLAVPTEDQPEADLNLLILKEMIERLTGHRFNFRRPEEIMAEVQQNAETTAPAEGTEASAETAAPSEGWGLIYEYDESHYESESTTFSAEGVVRTEDGREIAFTVDLAMSREFMSQQHISLRAGDALKDPLVINYNGTAAQLTQTKFVFDLDMDGTAEQIAFVGAGSGFLALDRNNDGQVNDGSELFGPATGSGFTELAAYDGDGNNWIDENDAVYEQLRIWSKNEAGEDSLLGLGQAGVGAIYLGHLNTPFALKDANNELQGQVTDTGVFLKENGGVGTVQELDLVV